MNLFTRDNHLFSTYGPCTAKIIFVSYILLSTILVHKFMTTVLLSFEYERLLRGVGCYCRDDY